MNYFYDLLINLNDDKAYEFYEWDQNDSIIHLKRVPIIKLNTLDFQNLLLNQIMVNQEFLDLIYNKTESYDKCSKFDYMCLFTDENSSLIIEFNKEGKSICRSKILLEEELDLLEIAYSLPKESIDYICTEKIENDLQLRQEIKIKKFLITEINTLYDEKNKKKLIYLYKEVTNQDENNIDVIKNYLIDFIKKDFEESHLKLYEIIKLSYKKLSA